MNASKRLLLLAGLLLAACADPDRDGGGPVQGGPTTVPTTPPTRATRPAGRVTLTGTSGPGSSPAACSWTPTAGAPYLLVGGERAALRPGARVAVTGRVERDLLSTCQQSEPLVVASIDPAP